VRGGNLESEVSLFTAGGAAGRRSERGNLLLPFLAFPTKQYVSGCLVELTCFTNNQSIELCGLSRGGEGAPRVEVAPVAVRVLGEGVELV